MAGPVPVLLQTFSEAAIALAEGFRALTKEELVALGYSPTSRRYTTQKAGIKPKSLKREKTIARRAFREKYVLVTEKQETYAKRRRAAHGGMGLPGDLRNRYAKAFAKKKGRKVRETQKDPEFARLMKIISKKNRSRTRYANQRRLEALYELGVLKEDDIDNEKYPELVEFIASIHAR